MTASPGHVRALIHGCCRVLVLVLLAAKVRFQLVVEYEASQYLIYWRLSPLQAKIDV